MFNTFSDGADATTTTAPETETPDLLHRVLVGHGGLARWREVSNVSARISATGSVWKLKGQADLLADVTIDVSTTTQRLVITPFARRDWRGVYSPERVTIEAADGTVIAERLAPRDAFAGHTVDTPWDHLHALYFGGYALWNYVNLPFVITWPGFHVQEIEGWPERPGHFWRRLRVDFPPNVHTHNPIQDLYVGEHGLIVRHDPAAHALGSAPSAQYLSSYRDVEGLQFPTSRTVLPRGEDNRPTLDPPMVVITLHDYALTWARPAEPDSAVVDPNHRMDAEVRSESWCAS
jgi:hypothetical protein